MSKNWKIFGFILWGAVAVWGATSIYGRLAHGHAATNYGSYVPWGLWISFYIYFIGLSAGAFLLSSLIYVFGIEKLRPVGRKALLVAAITLLMALLSVWFDLGHMARFYEVFTRPNFHSMMAWMIWLYTGYFMLILLELWFELRVDLALRAERGGRLAPLYRLLTLGWRPDRLGGEEAARERSHRVMKILGAIGIPLAIAFHGGVGALFATLSARPYWHTGLFPILFLTGALLSGGALILALTAAQKPSDERAHTDAISFLSRVVLGLLILDLILEWAEFSIPLWYAVGPEADLYHEIMFGEYWYVLWIAHLLLGAVVPISLFLFGKRRPWTLVLAGLLVATTFLSVRLNLVIPGQITPALEGLRDAYVDQRLRFSYYPSLAEWGVGAGVFAIGSALFWLGLKTLPLSHDPEVSNA